MPPKLDPPRQGGGPNPPYGEDYFQRIVNVNWGGGPPEVLGKGITILLPSVEPGVTIISLPFIRRTVLKDGLLEVDQASSKTASRGIRKVSSFQELKPWMKKAIPGLSQG